MSKWASVPLVFTVIVLGKVKGRENDNVFPAQALFIQLLARYSRGNTPIKDRRVVWITTVR